MNGFSFENMDIKFCWLIDNHEGLDVPQYKTPDAVGMDIQSAETVTLLPGQFKAVSTGLGVIFNSAYEIQCRPRSGLAAKHGVTVLNTPGTIDPDYRGEIKVILINHGNVAFDIKRGDRIAQLVVAIRAGYFMYEEPLLSNPNMVKTTPATLGTKQYIRRSFGSGIISKEDFDKFITERGDGGFGSTGV